MIVQALLILLTLALTHVFLKFVGIDTARIPAIAEMAIHDSSAGGNPLRLSKNDYAELLANAIKGVLG